MDVEEYLLRGKEMVNYIADYLKNIRSRRVFPGVSPGYMRKLIPEVAPENGEDWESIFADIERVIMPGITHWQSPHMHAYFPALNSYPALLGDMLSDAINCVGFTWASSPACTELETIVMDWLGKMIGLPDGFLHSNDQTMGGGVIQTTASESTFVCLLAARTEAIARFRSVYPNLRDAEINARLVAYCSDQAHCSVEKASLIGLVQMRFLESDDNLSLRGRNFASAIKIDQENGLIPFFLCATLGTTGACAFDNLKELGPICEKENIWMHIDAAYAGAAFICPEFRTYMSGIEYAKSFAFNPSKWLMVTFDLNAMWIKDSGALHRTFNVDPLYLKHANTGAAIDYMHWQVPLSRRFRSLKLWFVLRNFGVKGLQEHIRRGVRLAALFESLVRNDDRFEIPAKRLMGLIVFRLRGPNDLTEALLKKLNNSGRVHMVPASLKSRYVIRFTVTSTYTTDDDIRQDWSIIQEAADSVLKDVDEKDIILEECLENSPDDIFTSAPRKMSAKRLSSLKRTDFGLSLLLSNVPMSPRFINGSFAAIFDNNDVCAEYVKYLSSEDKLGQPIPFSPRRRIRSERQNSLDVGRPYLNLDLFKQSSLDSKIQEIFEFSPDKNETPLTEYPDRLHVMKHNKNALKYKFKPEPNSLHQAIDIIERDTLKKSKPKNAIMLNDNHNTKNDLKLDKKGMCIEGRSVWNEKDETITITNGETIVTEPCDDVIESRGQSICTACGRSLDI